jgi:hypothetical protein
MSPQEAYFKMWSFFDPELEEMIPNGQDKIEFAITHLAKSERKMVLDFLDSVVNQGLSDEQLSEIWEEGGSRIALVHVSDYRKAFEQIRRRLADSLGI